MQIIACANLSRMRFWRPKLTSIICNFARGIIYDFKFYLSTIIKHYHTLFFIIKNAQPCRLGLAGRHARVAAEWLVWASSTLHSTTPLLSVQKTDRLLTKKRSAALHLQKIVPLRYTSKNIITLVCHKLSARVFDSECNERFFVRAKPVFFVRRLFDLQSRAIV